VPCGFVGDISYTSWVTAPPGGDVSATACIGPAPPFGERCDAAYDSVATAPPKQPDPEDSDADGCSDARESGPNAGQGGERDYLNVWDFFDVPDASNVRDNAVAAADIFRVLQRFGAAGDRMIDPLSAPPAAPAYHTAFDRGPAVPGGDPWDLSAANGSIASTDVFAALTQFGHTCA
jgi:hypothetical protein